MRYVLYCVVYSSMLVGLFITFLYLMTVMDPGLLQLSEKAARMMKEDRAAASEGAGELPSDMYIDFSELLNGPRLRIRN